MSTTGEGTAPKRVRLRLCASCVSAAALQDCAPARDERADPVQFGIDPAIRAGV
jgi:hypothetical protein